MSHQFRPDHPGRRRRIRGSSRPARGAAAAAALAGVAAIGGFSPAASAATSYEQVSRADGTAGAAPFEGSFLQDAVITDDGRTVISEFTTSSPSWASARGIWRRDVDTDRSTQIVGGTDAQVTGLTSDGKTLSFVTRKKLSAADRNTLPDLYSYTLATGKTELISRWDGAAGQAIGLTDAASGFITRDGRSALFATPVGIGRRELAAGTTVKLPGSDTALLGPSYGQGSLLDGTASADGRVYISGAELVSPTRRTPIDFSYPTSQARVSESGAVAAYEKPSRPGELAVIDSATGVERSVRFTPEPGNFRVSSFGADDRSAVVVVRTDDQTGSRNVLTRVDLATGATTDLGLRVFGYDAPAVSRNLHFAVAAGKWATAADGFTLPGGYGLPSPAVTVGASSGCLGTGWPFYVESIPVSLGIDFTSYGTAPRSIAIKVWNAGGTLVLNQTFSNGTVVELNTKNRAYKLQATVTYVDGRTTTETWTQPQSPGCLIPL